MEGDDALCEDVAVTGRDSRSVVAPVQVEEVLLTHGGVAIGRWPHRRRILVKYVDEFRNGELARAVAAEIASITDPDRHYKIMEVCGGHTHTIYRHGIKDLLPEQVELVHGPGCPVCVLPMGRVDEGVEIAERPEVVFTCFGDMMRVPGSKGNLLEVKAEGADIRMVYSPLDALRIARENPDREVVFYAIGFETTAPSTALTLQRAKKEGIENFSVFCNHVTIVPPVRALLDSPDLRLDAFIGPGHVSTVVGCRPYEFMSEDYGKPCVVAGFEPLDLLQSILMLMRQLDEGRCEVENQYGRIVPGREPASPKGMAEVFELRPYFEWRGLGFIAQSALKALPGLRRLRRRAALLHAGRAGGGPEGLPVRGGLEGRAQAPECKVFGTACTPERPLGALMVSSEGACAAYYNFGRKSFEKSR
jgi:hydrogenase expression/formation protein HypD